MKEIILASMSPRRREILTDLSLDFKVMASDIDEIIDLKDKPEVTAMALAFEKARNVSERLDSGLVIGADTLVYLDGEYLEKPNSRKDAFEMLRRLSGKSHMVITGLSIIEVGTLNKLIDYSSTIVTMKNFGEDYINRYLDTGEYKDKAGSYGIQGYGGLLVKEISGSYTNVVGLPIELLEDMLIYFNQSIL